ncbi:TPA: hypothetical protein DDW69_03740 [candidate division CPR2 bacterium]|nr:MAG: hypothetical protein A2Y27_03770 [candidate division CPR2 bacterium GWD1_39_7]OGB71165.1 MAG: hypothetical protein A2Y26_04105 [candidate division CPR2 bacterium GWD2_39_7]HBG81927.1 hypothetical protein [candidate division CPR2 bacterium]HCL99900.1 hypothetical protein [candidate division CPR2 bacterium]
MFKKLNHKKRILKFQKNILGFYDKFPKLLHVKRFVFTLLLVVGAICMMFWQSFNRLPNYFKVSEPDFGGVYSEGVTGTVDNLNPVFASTNSTNSEVSSLIFSGLTKYNELREIVPDLAYNWTVSDDGKEYTFSLRRNAKWHKSNEFVKAQDVVFTVNAIQNPDTRSPLKENWRGVQAKVQDDWTVKFVLPHPNYSFLELTTVGIIPESSFKEVPAKNMSVSKFNLDPIGSGPFEFESLSEKQHGQELTLIASNDYFPHPAFLDKIVFKTFKEKSDLLKAYSKKDIYGIAGLTLEDYETSKKFNNLNYIEMQLPRYVALFFNVKDGIFSDVNLRKAISKAINKDALISDTKILGMVTNYPILPGLVGYSKDIPKITQNLEETNKILDDAGWKKEGDFRKKGDKILEFEVITNNSLELKRASENIKNQLKPLGINVVIKDVDINVLQQEYIKPRRYQAILIGESLGADSDLYGYWHSTQITDPGLNLSQFANDKLDKYLEAARQSKDEGLKRDKLIAAQKIIQNEMPAVFLYNPSFIYAVNKNFKGVKHVKMIDPSSRFNGIYDWFVKTKKENKI